MLQDDHTKNIFRELDGFLILMSLLSNIQDRPHKGIVEPEEQVLLDVFETIRLIFVNLAEAMNEHLENSEYFRVCCQHFTRFPATEMVQNIIGYESLANSLRVLTLNPKASDQTFGLVLSFALNNFDVSDIFLILRATSEQDVDLAITGFESCLRTIRRPGAISILWEAIPQATVGDQKMRYAMFKIFELLSNVNHRNQAILGSLGIVKSVFGLFYGTEDDLMVPEKERYVLQKILRRLLDMGATTLEARSIFEKALKSDGTLDTEVLDLIRFGMKSRWLEHLSLESPAALSLNKESFRGLPHNGFTFMVRIVCLSLDMITNNSQCSKIWSWISALTTTSHSLFTVHVGSKVFLSLRICPDGSLELSSSGNEDSAIFKVKIRKLRWTHIALVYYPNRLSNPSVRQSNTVLLDLLSLTTSSGLFVDGALSDTRNWKYPKPESTSQTGAYVIGDVSKEAKMSWCIASAYLIASPLGMSLFPLKFYTQTTNLITDDDVPRLIHQLGPRYTGNFQDPALVKFLTYEASTSLNMALMTIASQQPNSIPQSSLMKIVREGLKVPEASICFAISPVNARESGPIASISTHGLRREFAVQGDAFVVKAEPLHMALWKIGGAAVALKLVQAAGASVIA